MLLGDRDRFAIEYELDPAPVGDVESGHWMFGRVRWWCGGEPVGRFEPETALGAVAATADRVLRAETARYAPELMACPAESLARYVTDALFAEDGRSDGQIAADGARYWPFFVRPGLDSFDPWDVLVVEGSGEARLIWGVAGRRAVRECRLAAGEFAGVLREFLRAVKWDV